MKKKKDPVSFFDEGDDTLLEVDATSKVEAAPPTNGKTVEEAAPNRVAAEADDRKVITLTPTPDGFIPFEDWKNLKIGQEVIIAVHGVVAGIYSRIYPIPNLFVRTLAGPKNFYPQHEKLTIFKKT